MIRALTLLVALSGCSVMDPDPMQLGELRWGRSARFVYPKASAHEGECLVVDEAVVCFVRYETPLAAFAAAAQPRRDGAVFEVDRASHVVVHHPDPAYGKRLLDEYFAWRVLRLQDF